MARRAGAAILNDSARPGRSVVGVLMAVLSACGFACKGIFAKYLYAGGWDYQGVLTTRALLALPLLWAWALVQTRPGALRGAAPGALLGAALAGLLCYYAGALTDFHALMLIDAGVERVLLFAYPSMVVLLHAVLYRTWPTRTAWVSLALTYAGILLVVSGFDARILSANLAGAGLVLFAAFSFAVYYLAGDQLTRRIGSLPFSLAALTASAAALAVHYLVTRGWPRAAHWTSRDVGLMAGLVVFSTILPMVLMAEGVRRLGAPRAAVVSTVGPPTTIVLGALLLGETLSAAQWTGVALIAAGILVLELAKRATLTPPEVA